MTDKQQITEEIYLTDGQTESIPEPELQPNQPEDFSAGCSMMTATTIDEGGRYYTAGEFEASFNEFLNFLKSPDVSFDAFESLRAQGQQLAAGKVYNMAQKYKFLNWLIDRRTAIFHDFALISIFFACETNAIVQNWTGISLAEKAKIWLRGKIKAHAAAQAEGKRKGWGFLGRRGAEKPQKPESLQQA